MDENIKQNSPQEPAPKPASPTQGGSVSYSRSDKSLSNFFDKFSPFFTKKTVAGLVILILVIGVGAATIAVQRSTEIRQRAATVPPPTNLRIETNDCTGSNSTPRVQFRWTPPSDPGSTLWLDVAKDPFQFNSYWNRNMYDNRKAGIFYWDSTRKLKPRTADDDWDSYTYAPEKNTTYYWRLYDGTTTVSAPTSFTTQACGATPTVTPGGNPSDLIPQNLARSITSPAVGQSVTFSGKVKNQTGNSAGASTARFCVEAGNLSSAATARCTTGNSPWWRDIAVPSLGAYVTSSTLTTEPWVPSASGTHTVYFIVDMTQAVAETSESNNLTTQTFTVASGPTATPVATLPCRIPAPLSGAGNLYGDVNRDGQITDSDAVMILNYVARREGSDLASAQMEAADVDDSPNTVSSRIDITSVDALFIRQYIANPIPSFPVCPAISPTATPTPTTSPGATITPGATATPVPTIPAGNTVFALTIGLDGLGTTGDNNTPNDSSGSNRNPQHPSRNIKVEVFNGSGNSVANRSGTLTYQTSSGKFTGNVDMGNLASGNYIVKVKSDGYLRRLIPGIQNITLGQTNNVPAVNLVTGDINNDNAINILDYNILISCSVFSTDNHAACSANSQYAVLSDLEDNGVINQYDYNLFLRELSVQNGD